MEDIVVENIITEAKIGKNFDMDKIASRMKNIKYNPEEFPGIIIKTGRIQSIILGDGRLITAGARSMEEAKKTLNKVVDMLRENGIEASKRVKMNVKNIVISKDIKKWLNLGKLTDHLSYIEYNPDKFPGAIWRNKEGLIALLFDSGKIICTGTKDKSKLENFLEGIVKKIEEVG